MTKPLHQIQQENRKFILEAIHDCSYYESARDGIIEIIGKPITLNRVLLALKDKLIGYYDDGLGYIVYKKRLFSHDWYHEVQYICDWDLTIETLEEQTEETQRKINKLFNN